MDRRDSGRLGAAGPNSGKRGKAERVKEAQTWMLFLGFAKSEFNGSGTASDRFQMVVCMCALRHVHQEGQMEGGER